MRRAVADWLDSRTGFRAARKHLLDEPLPAGTGWWFVTGSVVLFLIAVQFVTGVVLTMYYVPAPDHAYDSVRFIMDQLPFGGVLRGLHVFGASFIVVAALVHMLRVVALGSYRKPREMTWITGRGAAAAHPRLRAERLPAAVGPEGVLGHDRHHQRRPQRPDGRIRRGPAAGRERPRPADAAAVVLGARVPAAGVPHRRSSSPTST